ncbi:hypothetical protein IAT40_006355 [Kwoniella sp. CBS 6097]
MTIAFLDKEAIAPPPRQLSSSPPLPPPKSPIPIKSSFSLRRIHSRTGTRTRSKSQSRAKSDNGKDSDINVSDDPNLDTDSTFPLLVPTLPPKYASSLDLSRLASPPLSSSQSTVDLVKSQLQPTLQADLKYNPYDEVSA